MLNSFLFLFISGVILYTLLSGRTPFRQESEFNKRNDVEVNNKIRRRIKKEIYLYNTKDWVVVSKSAKDLLDKILVVKPEDRITLSKILEHDWFRDESSIDAGEPFQITICEKGKEKDLVPVHQAEIIPEAMATTSNVLKNPPKVIKSYAPSFM